MPICSPYPGLETWIWRDIFARAAVFHAARARLAELSDHIDRSDEIRLALCDLQVLARSYAAGQLDDESMLAAVITAWDVTLSRTLELDQLDPSARALLSEIRDLASRACQDDPFQRIFARVAELARNAYGEGWRAATLAVSHIGSPPRIGDDPYAVTAVTAWPPASDEAEVELRIHCARFGPAAFAALPMLLVHECICHVPARQSGVIDNSSTFAEGLLDWVAYVYHEQWAVKLDRMLAPAARSHARSLRDVLRRGDSPACRARQLGHRAADNLQAWFEDDREQPPMEAQMSVVKLAVQLNLVDRSLAEKDRFVSLLDAQLPPCLQDALRGWDDGLLDADQLLGAVPAA
ncbi:MAG TPA: hypothetical protein VNP92_12315 [Actinophytocola sp.]|nr:hypothetical protein [Actinophytocola sp.]